MCKEDTNTKPIFSYEDVRKHNKHGDSWLVIHGKVYNVSEFDHPAGDVIQIGYGREATALYESHHGLIRNDKNEMKFQRLLKKYEIGTVRNPPKQPDYNSPFARELKEKCQEAMKKEGRVTQVAPNWLDFSVVPLRPLLILLAAYMTATTRGWEVYAWAYFWGICLTAGQGMLHAASHRGLSRNYYINMFCRVFGETWGLREANWEFAHVISHHMECYTQQDYMIDQHVPPEFFRIYESTPYVERYKYQHIWYVISIPLAIMNGGVRWNCAPFSIILPFKKLYESMRTMNNIHKTPFPGPRNMPPGSSHTDEEFKPDDTLNGPHRFMIFESLCWQIRAFILGNVITLPVFLTLCKHRSILEASFIMLFAYGIQSAAVVENTLTQHLVEDVIVHPTKMFQNDWYAHQIASSSEVKDSGIKDKISDYIGWQVCHHSFPPLWGSHAVLLQPIMAEVTKKHNVPYLVFTMREARESVFRFLWKHSTPNCDTPPKTPLWASFLLYYFSFNFLNKMIALYLMASTAVSLVGMAM